MIIVSAGQVGPGTRSGSVANLKYGSVLGDSTKLSVTETDREARVAGIVEVLDHLADSLETDDPTPGPVLQREVILKAAANREASVAIPRAEGARSGSRFDGSNLLELNLRARIPQFTEPTKAGIFCFAEAVEKRDAAPASHVVERTLTLDGL